MTHQQKRALDFIRKYIAEHGVSPSYEEIAQALGISSKGGVFRIVNALVQRGHLRREDKLHRCLVVVDQTPALAQFATAELVAELGRRAHG